MNKYATPLILDLTPSSVLARYIFMLGLATLLVVVCMTLHWALKIVLSLLVLLVLYNAWVRYVRLDDSSVRRLVWEDSDQWRLVTKGQRELAATLLPGSLIHPQLVILTFCVQASKTRRTILLFADSTSQTALRRLRVRLRMNVNAD